MISIAFPVIVICRNPSLYMHSLKTYSPTHTYTYSVCVSRSLVSLIGVLPISSSLSSSRRRLSSWRRWFERRLEWHRRWQHCAQGAVSVAAQEERHLRQPLEVHVLIRDGSVPRALSARIQAWARWVGCGLRMRRLRRRRCCCCRRHRCGSTSMERI